jgi:hypothetical protein
VTDVPLLLAVVLLRATRLLLAVLLLRPAALLLAVVLLRTAGLLRPGAALRLGLRLRLCLRLARAPVTGTLGSPGRQRLPTRRVAAACRQPAGVGFGPLRPRRLEYR